jgi:hypothetical protein
VSDLAKKQPTRPVRTTGKPAERAIDCDKLRAALRRLGDEYVFYMLDEAIDLLPPAKLAKLVSRYLDLKQLRPDMSREQNLLAAVRAFDAASRAQNYYESFNVNSKNFTDKSMGTRAFIADCNRLLDRCVAKASKKSDAAEVREAIEIILGLLRYIDECHDDVIFFADEGGSWQVGVDWAKVLPAWFACLSLTTDPDAYARRVVEVVDEFDKHDRGKQLSVARRIGTPSQRKALQNVAAAGAR